MEAVKIVDAGEQLVVTGGDREAVQAALDDLAARGSRILSPVAAVGSRFTATASHPTDPPTPSAPDDAEWFTELERIAALRSVTIADAGTHLILTANDRASLELALTQLAPAGVKPLGAIAAMGSRWIASCEHPDLAEAPCTVEVLGLKAVVSGRHLVQVQAKLDELQRGGGTVIAVPELQDGVWTAIVDLGEKQQGMRFY